MSAVDLLQDAEPGQQFLPEPTPEEERWAALIVADLRSSIANIISAGLNLLAAKADLPHGSWLPMLSIAGVGERKAQALMQISRNPVLANPQHGALLPTSWNTLSILARLDEETVLEALESGQVGPDTDRAGAEALARSRASERDLGDEDTTSDPEPGKAKASPQEHAEQRDAAVFSVKQAVTRIGDCLKIINSPGFRLTTDVAQDIYRELNKLDKVYGDLLLAVDEEVGSSVRPPARGKKAPIQAVSRPAPQAGNAGLKVGSQEVTLGGQSDHIGDTTITLEQYNAREGL